MNMSFTDGYDRDILRDAMMGPNAMRIAEEMAGFLPLSPGMRILDLGCGMGISSILLAEKYGATVFAADLWISPTENAKRFSELRLDAKIVPLSLDATKEIPFAHEYFDIIFSVDAYQYFGDNDGMLPKLLPFVKHGGFVAVAVPGFIRDFPEGSLPPEVQPFWTPEWYFYSSGWWRSLWQKQSGITIVECREMDCCQQAWDEWLQSSNPHAEHDRAMMDAGAGKYFAFIQIIAKKG